VGDAAVGNIHRFPLATSHCLQRSCLYLQTKASEADILAAVGDGGFSPEEFELLQELGTINIQQVGKPLLSRSCLVVLLGWGSWAPTTRLLPPFPLQVAASMDIDDFVLPTSQRSARTAVIAYTASFFSGMPFQVGWGGQGQGQGKRC